MSGDRRRLTRREALRRVGLMTSALALPGCLEPEAPEGDAGITPWQELTLVPVSGPGYGSDPVLIAPEPVPWSRTLDRSELDLVAALAERICPGAADAGVPDVIDEWLSAPYPLQQQDRALLMPGFAWLDGESRARYGAAFTGLSPAQSLELVELLDQPPDEAPRPLRMPVRFFDRFRALVAGAYFSSPAGLRELGYLGNVPLAGDYPGPSAQAMTHLEQLLAELNLEL